MVFDSSVTMLEAAQAGVGIAIAPVDMFTHLLNSERIVQPFATRIDPGVTGSRDYSRGLKPRNA